MTAPRTATISSPVLPSFFRRAEKTASRISAARETVKIRRFQRPVTTLLVVFFMTDITMAATAPRARPASRIFLPRRPQTVGM